MNMYRIGRQKPRKWNEKIRSGLGVTKEETMLAVFATLTFLTAMWLCAIVVAGAFEQNGSKIIAALKGHSPLALASIRPIEVRVSQRYPSPAQRPMRTRVELRAAA